MNTMAGRAVAAVGIVIAFLTVWISAFDFGGFKISYWDSDGTTGGFLLALAALSSLLLVAGLATGRPVYDLVLVVVGSVLWGLLLFFPVVLAGAHWEVVATGGWLGVCTCLIPLGALVAYAGARQGELRSPAPTSQRRLGATGVAGAGVVLALFAMFLDVESGENGSYWSVPENGHSLGIVLLIVLVVAVVALAAAVALRSIWAALIATGAAAVAFGLLFYVPLTDAFNQLGDLGAGAWVGVAGGGLALVGAFLAWHETITPALREPPAPA